MNFKCALCGGGLFNLVSKRDGKSRRPLYVGICKGCSLVQQLEPPTQSTLADYYSHSYRGEYKGTYAPKLKHVFRAAKAARDRLHFLENALSQLGARAPERLSLLDIGAGGGEFVYLACQKGFEATGIEPNIGYSDFARANYGVAIKTLHLHQIASDKFDVVTLFHVLEHLPDPIATMALLHRVVSESGLLFIEIPNIEQLDASPANIFFRAHIYYFSAATLVSVASQFFDLVQLESRGNIKAIFVRRNAVSSHVPPNAHDIQATFERLQKKGWLEYLTVGGGWKKPVKKIIQIFEEYRLKEKSPRSVLDSIARDMSGKITTLRS